MLTLFKTKTISPTEVPIYDTIQLNKEAQQREEIIKRIKQNVSTEYDNIRNPVPLFKQLHS